MWDDFGHPDDPAVDEGPVTGPQAPADCPVIFLDMDGVITTQRAHQAQLDLPYPDCWLDPIAIRFLNMLCQGCGAAVVVSPTWRKGTSRSAFAAMLERNGFVGVLHRDWRTPHLPGLFRGNEVRDWMGRHPEVAVHAILDDEADFHADQPLVRTDAVNGLQLQHVQAAFELLSDDPLAMMRASQGKLGTRRR